VVVGEQNMTSSVFELCEHTLNKAVQTRSSDELQKFLEELSDVPGSTADGVRHFIRGGLALNAREFKSAIAEYQNARDVFGSIGYNLGKAHAASQLGIVLHMTDDYNQALECYRSAMLIFSELDQIRGVASVTGNMGLLYTHTGKHLEAMECYQRALAFNERIGDKRYAAITTSCLGQLSVSLGNRVEAFEYYQQSLELYKEIDSKDGIAIVTGNIGIVYYESGNYPEALEHFHIAFDIGEARGDTRSIAIVAGNLGNAYTAIRKTELAIEYYKKSIALQEVNENKKGIAHVSLGLGRVYQTMGDYQSSQHYFRQAFNLFKEIGLLDDCASAVCALASLFVVNKDIDAAERIMKELSSLEYTRPFTIIDVERMRAELLLYKGRFDEAKSIIQSAIELAGLHEYRSKQAECYGLMCRLAEGINDIDEYIENHKQYDTLAKEISGKDAAIKLAIQSKDRELRKERDEREKERMVLYSALPKSVADRLIRGTSMIADDYDNAAILFMDVVGLPVTAVS